MDLKNRDFLKLLDFNEKEIIDCVTYYYVSM